MCVVLLSILRGASVIESNFRFLAHLDNGEAKNLLESPHTYLLYDTIALEEH